MATNQTILVVSALAKQLNAGLMLLIGDAAKLGVQKLDDCQQPKSILWELDGSVKETMLSVLYSLPALPA